MINNLNPILAFRKKIFKKVNTLKKTPLNAKYISTLITETRESIDSSENS